MQFFDPDHPDDEDRFILLGLSVHLRAVVVCHCFRQTETSMLEPLPRFAPRIGPPTGAPESALPPRAGGREVARVGVVEDEGGDRGLGVHHEAFGELDADGGGVEQREQAGLERCQARRSAL